jgi:biotin carboxyl carrier protein
LELIYLITIGARNFEVTINSDLSVVKIDRLDVDIDYRLLRSGKLHSILTDHVNHEFALKRSEGGFEVWHGSKQLHVEINDEKAERFKRLMGDALSSAKTESLKAPMPGLILKIEIEVGQTVKKGDGLIIIEAMKMENELKAHTSGIVKEIKVKPGQPVEKNQVLVIFE